MNELLNIIVKYQHGITWPEIVEKLPINHKELTSLLIQGEEQGLISRANKSDFYFITLKGRFQCQK